MLLNLVLLAALAMLAFRIRQVHASSREREARVLGERVMPHKYPPFPAAPPVQPIVAGNYLDVAQRMLMSRDRNPNVIIDPEIPKPKPVMPAMPSVQGLMMLGEPGIIMSEKPGGAQKTYRKGERVGPFKLVAFDSEKVVFDWDGEKVERKLDDLLEKTPPPAAGAAPAAGVAASPAPTVANVAPQTPPAGTPQGPGIDIGGGYRACQPNDSTPTGTVRDGLRKVQIATPFGPSCKWEPASR